MGNSYWTRWLLSLVVCAGAIGTVTAREGGEEEAVLERDKGAIEKAIQSYVSAFNARDAAKLAAHWSPEGVYISRRDEADPEASQISGRDALTEEFTALFAESADVRLEVATENVAIALPAAVYLTSGSRPRRPRSMTLFRDLSAMATSRLKNKTFARDAFHTVSFPKTLLLVKVKGSLLTVRPWAPAHRAARERP